MFYTCLWTFKNWFICTMGEAGKGCASQGCAMCSSPGDAAITSVLGLHGLGTYVNSLWQYTSSHLTSMADF